MAALAGKLGVPPVSCFAEHSVKQGRPRYQQGSLKTKKREGGREVWIYRWREIRTDGSYRPRKLVVGSVEELPTKKRAWQAVAAMRLNINCDVSERAKAPNTVSDLIAHYKATELSAENDGLSYSTKETHTIYLDNWIEPKWGELTLAELEELPGVYVENWLKSLRRKNGPMARGTKAKLRNLLSGLCSHAMRYGWMKVHPIQGKVRQSAKPEIKQVPLTVEELQALYAELPLMYRVLLLLLIGLGGRRGEELALKWSVFDFDAKTVSIEKSIWHQVLGPVKTDESESVMPLDDGMIVELLAWRAETMYAKDDDFVFASPVMKGKQPYWPEGMMKNHIRPAAVRAGITKRISWHGFRHTFTTLLAQHADIKTVQSLVRHANPRLTLEVYTHAIDKKKRSAQSKVIEMVVPRKQVEGQEVTTGS